MCFTREVKFSCGRPDHTTVTLEQCSRKDCPVKMGLERREVTSIPDTCMEKDHKIVDPHLPPPRR
jgi:hypothetical protein